MDEQKKVGENDAKRDGVGPSGLPARAGGTASSSVGVVQVDRDHTAGNVEAELHNLELSHVLLPPQINLQNSAEVVVILLTEFEERPKTQH